MSMNDVQVACNSLAGNKHRCQPRMGRCRGNMDDKEPKPCRFGAQECHAGRDVCVANDSMGEYRQPAADAKWYCGSCWISFRHEIHLAAKASVAGPAGRAARQELKRKAEEPAPPWSKVVDQACEVAVLNQRS